MSTDISNKLAIDNVDVYFISIKILDNFLRGRNNYIVFKDHAYGLKY